MNQIFQYVLGIPAIIRAITLHEFTRAAVSTAFGDKMPREKKRLSLNPIKHFEPIGFILMLATKGFGWGKPVQTSALYYKNRKTATLCTAILPSVANFIFAIVGAFLMGIILRSHGNRYLYHFFSYVLYYNLTLAIYNVIPVTPMDCTKVLSVLMPANKYFTYMHHEKIIQMCFLLLLFFGFVGAIFMPVIYFVQGLILSIAL